MHNKENTEEPIKDWRAAADGRTFVSFHPLYFYMFLEDSLKTNHRIETVAKP